MNLFAAVACVALAATVVSAQAPAGGTFANPVVPGFAPDPSICRAGDDFYLANSSFTMLPGLPIYRSGDLVNWQLIGHAVAGNAQASFVGSTTDGGIYAPTIRHHDGTFYLIVKNTTSGHNELYTTNDPSATWDGPRAIGPDWSGDIDPDLFFDADGTAYVARRIGIGDGSKAEQFAWRFDPKMARVTSDKIPLWNGTGQHVWPEGGHLYRIGDFYYYLLAEGGTGPNHRATIARKPVGSGLEDASQQWEPCPHNPILFNAPAANPEITTTGHVDLVSDAGGNWWAVFLAQRPKPLPDLGRETYLAPVEWRDGWPVVNQGKPITREMRSTSALLTGTTRRAAPTRDEFDAATLPLHWNFLRRIDDATFSLTDRPGWLTLNGRADGPDSKNAIAWVGRRLLDKSVSVTVRLDFAPTDDTQCAGINLFSKIDSYSELIVRRASGRREAVVRTRDTKGLKASDAIALPGDGPVTLEFAIRDERITFRSSTDDGKAWSTVADLASSEAIAFPGFAGLYVAMHAVGDGSVARFDWFDYAPMR